MLMLENFGSQKNIGFKYGITRKIIREDKQILRVVCGKYKI